MLIEGYVGEVDASQMKMIKTAYASNERQLVIVNDLLRVAQADANELQLRFAQTDIAELMKDVINEQAKKFQISNQVITFENSCKNSVAMIDPLHIRMVFENLIDNAHKYTPRNKKIYVALAEAQNSLVMTIKDEGIGIYKKDIPKLFKKFSRIENPLSTSAGGTGLGLYWVHKIIDTHQGTINVTSRYGQGTQFTITLPVSKDSKK
jgi:signal transduction histidine kinase